MQNLGLREVGEDNRCLTLHLGMMGRELEGGRSCLTLSHPESVMETFNALLTFESVDEILWCDHSNETSSAVLSHIPAAFFDRFFLWSFWSSSTLPRLVCLAYVRGFYFLFCCVEVSSVMLCCVCCVALRCVVLCCGPLCCVALCCNPLCCVALRCVAIRCVASVLLRCVVLRSVMLSVLSRCVALCCDPL